GVPVQVGKPPQKAPEPAAPPPAAETAQGSPNAASEAPLMPDAAFRVQAPPPLAQQPHFDPPVPIERKLKNGARVLIVENHAVPLVAIGVRFLHGVDADPKDKPGLAEFVADMVDEGTKKRPAQKLAEEVEDLAAHLGAGASLETASVNLNCLTETLPKALELLAGDVKPAEIVRLLEEKFASWKPHRVPALSLPPFPKLNRRAIVALEKPGTTQAQVWVIGRLFKATDPDAIPMRVANLTLGGLFTSRLNMNLREKHGYSY